MSPRTSACANFVGSVADQQLTFELPEPAVIAGTVRSVVPEPLSQQLLPEIIASHS